MLSRESIRSIIALNSSSEQIGRFSACKSDPIELELKKGRIPVVKKSSQAAARYAKRSGKGKKKQPQKSYPERQISLVSEQREPVKSSPNQGVGPKPQTRATVGTSRITSAYSYVVSDLKRTAIFAVGIFVILILLAIFLG